MTIGPIALVLIAVFIWAVFGRNQIRAMVRAFAKIRRRGYHREYVENVIENIDTEDPDVRQT